MIKDDFYRGRYLPSNETIVNVALRDHNLNLQTKFSRGYFYKKQLANANIIITIR